MAAGNLLCLPTAEKSSNTQNVKDDRRTERKDEDEQYTPQHNTDEKFDQLRRGKIRDGKRYIGHGARQAVRYQDGKPCDD